MEVFAAEIFKVGEVDVEPLIAKVLEQARERMVGAEPFVADGGEVEEIVPGATGVLQIFEASGHGRSLWSGHGFALVAGALGGFAYLVQVFLALLAGVEQAFDPLLDGSEQIVDADPGLFGGLEGGEESFGVARESGELLLDGCDQFALVAPAIFGDAPAEFVLSPGEV